MKKRLIYKPYDLEASIGIQLVSLDSLIAESSSLEQLDSSFYIFRESDSLFLARSIVGFDSDVFEQFAHRDLEFSKELSSKKSLEGYESLLRDLGKEHVACILENFNEYFLLTLK